ncbi:MAG: hypothetical protein HDQ98_11760 [Lachnospiraceae bacterium]|nr:hypothetical protein [Lachnospiraceae bacterium]
MEYKNFVEQVRERIKDFLPEKFADADVEVNQVIKNNDCTLDGLVIRTEESNVTPTIYLNPYFEQIGQGAELDDVLHMIADTYQANYINRDVDMSAVLDYDSIKDKIVCKLINGENNRQFLENKPYTEMEDLAVVYQILLNKNKDNSATITISDNLMDIYGITVDELHEQAMQNMSVLQPYSLKSMNETVIDIFVSDMEAQGMSAESAREMASLMLPDTDDMVALYVLTNDTKFNGAAEILNDNVRQEIADKIGDFYVLPSSVHETLIIPKSEDMDRKQLEQMVCEVNETQVLPEERLSDHVYEYDAKTHELFRSDRAEERKMQRGKTQEMKQGRPSLKGRLDQKRGAVIKMDTGQKKLSADKKREVTI